MSDQQPLDSTPPSGDASFGSEPPPPPAADAGQPFGEQPLADEPIPEGGDAGAAGARAREWMSQLETMIQEVTTQAAPVVRQVGAKAAELAAVAAVKAGPIAQKAAEVTSEYGQRFAERAQAVAAELREADAHGTNGSTGHESAEATGESSTATATMTEEPPAPEDPGASSPN
jgi:hypothetical protein